MIEELPIIAAPPLGGRARGVVLDETTVHQKLSVDDSTQPRIDERRIATPAELEQ